MKFDRFKMVIANFTYAHEILEDSQSYTSIGSIVKVARDKLKDITQEDIDNYVHNGVMRTYKDLHERINKSMSSKRNTQHQ